MNKEIFNKVNNNNNEIFNILEYMYNFGINNLEDIEKLYLNNKFSKAKKLKTFNNWNELGYKIKASEHGIRIYKGKDSTKVYFDISQVVPIENKEKPLYKPFLKNPLDLFENRKNKHFSIDYLDNIKNYIENDKLSEQDKAVVENLVQVGVLEEVDYYTNSKILSKEEMRKNTIDIIKNITKSDFFDNIDKFEEIVKETANTLRKVLVKIYNEANSKNMVENRVLDKTQTYNYTINSDNSQYQNQNQRIGGSEYGNELRNEEIDKRRSMGRQGEEAQRARGNIGSNENGNVEDGRQGRNNGQSEDIYNNGKQLSQTYNRLHTTSSRYGQPDNNAIRKWDRRNDQDRPMGQYRNEGQQENGAIDRRNQSRIDESTLSVNAKEQTKNQRYNGNEERNNNSNFERPRTTTQQMENTTNILNELQENDKSRVSKSSEQEDRDSGREVSKQISEQKLEDIFTSEIINDTRNSENSERGDARRDSERKSGINNDNINNNEVDEKSSTSFFAAIKTENTEEIKEKLNKLNNGLDEHSKAVYIGTNENGKDLFKIQHIPTTEELLKLDYINEKEQNENKFNFKEKFEDNINAIKTLKTIENEKRNATKEEQSILAKYVGWGGLANYCLDETRASKENLQIIKDLLTDDELRAAKDSVNSAYFTPDYIVKEIYNKIEKFGFKGGKILEPSCGTGKFLMNMPKEIRENSDIVGIEKDSISARISKLLYPSMTIKNKGFEEEKIENNTYNLVIGNIPFGQVKLYDKEYERDNLLIHDYFINKSLDKLADGGIAAIISTTGTLDKKDDKARTLFAEKANFLGSVRLPARAFSDTKTSTDILFFQKNNENKLGINQSFVKSESLYNNAKDKINKRGSCYINTITNDIYSNFIYGYNPDEIMKKEMWQDLFVGMKQFEDIEPFDEEDYKYTRIKYDFDKFEDLKQRWENWVKNGRKENEKPIYDIKKDFYILPSSVYQEDIKELKNVSMYFINPGIENENYYEIKENKNGDIKLKSNEKNEDRYIYDENKIIKILNSKDVINENQFIEQFFSIPINNYYKYNKNNIIGDLKVDTGQYGRPIINSELKDIETIRKEIQNSFNNIKCEYHEQIAIGSLEDDEQIYIPKNEYNNNRLYELKKYSHFIYNDKICFNENDKAYYIKGLKKDKEDKLKSLIKLKETAHSILKEEENGNIDIANEKRQKLLSTYNSFYNKYKKRINDREIKELIAEDDDKGLLLSLEVGTDEIIEVIKTKKKALKGSIENYNVIGSEVINGKEVNIIEDDNGEQKFYDNEGTEYIKTQKTEFVIQEGNAGLAQIFFEPLIKVKSEIEHVENAKDGLILSLQTLGKINLDFISQKTNMSNEQIINDLKGLIYYDFIDENYITNDEFLSGNIIKKIEENKNLTDNLKEENNLINKQLINAEKENNEDEIKNLTQKITINNTKIQNITDNIEALKVVIPKKIPFENIDISIGATWLPEKYYNKFITDIFKVRVSNWSGGTHVIFNNKITPSSFNISNKKYATSNQIDAIYGTQDKNSLELFEAALNLTPVNIYDTLTVNGEKKQILNPQKTGLANSKIEEIKKAFVNWKENNFTNEEKEEIEEIYNNKFNCIVARKYNGDILDFPAMNQNISLKAHQKNGIARMVFGRNAGLAHCVGSGKTFEICAGVMKFKQLGLANKSMIVVPKPLIEQWQREFLNLYPTANVIAPTEKDFSKENRAKFLSKLATGNYDAIILSQEQFQKIPLSKERQIKYINEELDKYIDYIHEVKAEGNINDKLTRSTIKDIQKEIDNLNAQLLKLNNESNKDNTIDFEELHIDKLFVDEAHYYKNSYFATKLKRVAGIQSKMTKRTFDLQQKCKYLNEKTDYKGVYFATGTPITNSIVELYTMMKYLQDDKLNDIGINTLDDFVSNFCEIKTDFELDSTGNNYHQKTRVNTFKNVPEVIKLFKDSWDIVNVEDLTSDKIPEEERLNLPKIKRDTIVLPATAMQQHLTKDFISRSEKMQPGHAFDPKVDNHLKLTNDGKMAALDPRLYDNKLPDEKGTKTNALIDNVAKIYYDTMEEKGTQMIFSDIGVPKADNSFDIYNDIKNKLIAKGLAANEIAFIGDYDTPEKKQQMQQNMRDGKIRILIASTDKGGTGLNVQTKMKALHHLSLPWKPSDMEQREGRIYRQGNKWDEINIYTYISQGTFDARTFEILESKSKFIKQIMQGNETIRRYEDIGKDESSINYDDWVQMALPDSNIKKMKELERDIKILEEERNQFNCRIRENKARIKEIPEEIETTKNIKEYQIKDIKRLELSKKDRFMMKICNVKIGDVSEYDKKEVATKKLHKRIFEADKSIFYKTEYQKVAEYKGFDINIVYNSMLKHFEMKAKSKETGYLYETVELGESDVGNMTRIDNFIEKLNNERIENFDKKIKYLENEYNDLNKSVELKFEKEEILISKREELQNLHIKEEAKKQELMNNDKQTNSENQAKCL